MKKMATIMGGLAALGLALAPMQAMARDWHHGGHHWGGHHGHYHGYHGGYHGRYYHHHGGDAALGVIGGLAAGALIGGALASSAPGGGIPPRTRAWYEWCSSNYRSFNPNTGTYRGYDGADHYCVAR